MSGYVFLQIVTKFALEMEILIVATSSTVCASTYSWCAKFMKNVKFEVLLEEFQKESKEKPPVVTDALASY